MIGEGPEKGSDSLGERALKDNREGEHQKEEEESQHDPDQGAAQPDRFGCRPDYPVGTAVAARRVAEVDEASHVPKVISGSGCSATG